MCPDAALLHRLRFTRPAQRGFSLIEVLVAFAVLVPIVVVAAGVLPFFRLSSARAWTQVAATDLARERMEVARATDFSALASISEQSETRDGTPYRWSVQVSPLGDGSWRKRVVCRVSWDNPQSQNLAFETVVVRATADSTSSSETTSTTSVATPSATPGKGKNK